MKAKPDVVLTMMADQAAAATAPAFVEHLDLRPGGVDPLGLRQVNFDLMDRALPGLNNAATRLRPYIAVTWAWWKARNLLEQQGGQIEFDRLKGFVDRIEVLFVGSHIQAGEMSGLLGQQVLNRYRKGADGYVCTGPEWEAFRKKRTNTSLMAPVAYGPSIRTGGPGLGFLRTNEEGLMIPMEEVRPAVEAFDKAIRKVAGHPALSTLTGANVTLDELARFHRYWRTDAVSEREQAVGWRRLYADPVADHRRPTINLILEHLHSRRRGVDVEDLRLALARRARRKTASSGSAGAQAVWRALQTQQLYRYALEALLVWVLREIARRPASLTQLGAKLLDEVSDPNAANFGAWILEAPFTDLAFDPVKDPVSLIWVISQTSREGTWPTYALDGLRAALRIAAAEGEGTRLFSGQKDRLPLTRALERVRLISDLPLGEALEVLLSEWLIGQHIYWAVGRSGDDTQRLRLCLEEAGWTAVNTNPGFPNPTPDRLGTVLSLMADMGKVEQTEDGLYLPTS